MPRHERPRWFRRRAAGRKRRPPASHHDRRRFRIGTAGFDLEPRVALVSDAGVQAYVDSIQWILDPQGFPRPERVTRKDSDTAAGVNNGSVSVHATAPGNDASLSLSFSETASFTANGVYEVRQGQLRLRLAASSQSSLEAGSQGLSQVLGAITPDVMWRLSQPDLDCPRFSVPVTLDYVFEGSANPAVADGSGPTALSLSVAGPAGSRSLKLGTSGSITQAFTSGSSIRLAGLAGGSSGSTFSNASAKLDASLTINWRTDPIPTADLSVGGFALDYKNQEVTLSVGVSGVAALPGSTAAIYWGVDRGGILVPGGRALPEDVAFSTATGGTFRIPLDQLTLRPAGAAGLVVVLDPDDRVAERKECNNEATVRFADLRLDDFEWNLDRDGTAANYKRGVDLTYSVLSSALPSGVPVRFYWAKGPDPKTDIIKEVPEVEPNLSGDLFDARSELRAPVNFAARWGVPPANATHLLAVLDPDNVVPERDEANNVKYLVLPSEREILDHAVTVTADGSSITAAFLPGGGTVPLSAAEVALGVDHFNWKQEVLRTPGHWQAFTLEDVDYGRIATLAVNPQGQFGYQGTLDLVKADPAFLPFEDPVTTRSPGEDFRKYTRAFRTNLLDLRWDVYAVGGDDPPAPVLIDAAVPTTRLVQSARAYPESALIRPSGTGSPLFPLANLRDQIENYGPYGFVVWQNGKVSADYTGPYPDNLPYYLNESPQIPAGETLHLIQNSLPFALRFSDQPVQPASAIPFQSVADGGYLWFETLLVGVKYDGTFVDWTSTGYHTNFDWKSNAVYAGTGGVFDAVGWGAGPADRPPVVAGGVFGVHLFDEPPQSIPPTAGGLVVNGGQKQRSGVERLSIPFDQDLNIPALIADGTITQAVELRAAGAAGSTIALAPDRFRWDPSSRTLLVDLTIDGFGGGTRTLLADGRYELRLRAALIRNGSGTPLADTDGTADDFLTFGFHRLFGDTDGDGDVDNADALVFKSAMNTHVGQVEYLGFLDADGDGVIDVSDFNEMKKRYGKKVQS